MCGFLKRTGKCHMPVTVCLLGSSLHVHVTPEKPRLSRIQFAFKFCLLKFKHGLSGGHTNLYFTICKKTSQWNTLCLDRPVLGTSRDQEQCTNTTPVEQHNTDIPKYFMHNIIYNFTSISYATDIKSHRCEHQTRLSLNR